MLHGKVALDTILDVSSPGLQTAFRSGHDNDDTLMIRAELSGELFDALALEAGDTVGARDEFGMTYVGARDVQGVITPGEGLYWSGNSIMVGKAGVA